MRHTLDETGNYTASLAAKAEAFLANNALENAIECAQEAIQNLQDNSSSGEYPIQNIWWIYARICESKGDTSQAKSALYRAHQLVKARADQITSSELRQSYLENVRVNAAIIATISELK